MKRSIDQANTRDGIRLEQANKASFRQKLLLYIRKSGKLPAAGGNNQCMGCSKPPPEPVQYRAMGPIREERSKLEH